MTAPAALEPLAVRLDRLDWPSIAEGVETNGFAPIGTLLNVGECIGLIRCYDDPGLFRSRVVMARHGFGRGEYQYFRYPLEPVVEQIRQTVYPYLVPLADRWAERLGRSAGFPLTLDGMVERCRAGGQTRPTPLLLRYGPGDYNCLHADLYGEHVFPFQLAILLNAPGRDFDGGEFVLVETRPRMQSKVHVVALGEGAGVIFTVNAHPVLGTRGYHRTTLRHGVSPVQSGARMTLGVIFHDAA